MDVLSLKQGTKFLRTFRKVTEQKGRLEWEKRRKIDTSEDKETGENRNE